MSEPIVLQEGGRKHLVRLWRDIGARVGAEIGVWRGRFSERLCQEIAGLTLYCVDPWTVYPGYEEQKNDPVLMAAAKEEAAQRLAPYGCVLMPMMSTEAARQIADGSLDFVYLDANHSYASVLDDLTVWTPKIRPGGILAGHDYRESARKPFIQVKAAVDRFTREREIGAWYVLSKDHTPSFYWVVR